MAVHMPALALPSILQVWSVPDQIPVPVAQCRMSKRNYRALMGLTRWNGPWHIYPKHNLISIFNHFNLPVPGRDPRPLGIPEAAWQDNVGCIRAELIRRKTEFEGELNTLGIVSARKWVHERLHQRRRYSKCGCHPSSLRQEVLMRHCRTDTRGRSHQQKVPTHTTSGTHGWNELDRRQYQFPTISEYFRISPSCQCTV
jgi:hypothetical protein